MMDKIFTEKRNEALNFLEEHTLGTLATINSRGIPNLATVFFFVDKDFSCYFITKENTRKLENIQEREVSTLLCSSEDDLTSIELMGATEILTDTLSIVKIIERFQELVLNRKAGYWVPPISQLNAGQYVVCKFIPNSARMVVYSNEHTHNQEPEVHLLELRQ